MANFKQWVQQVFSGENDREQPNLIGDNELQECVNMLPMRDGKGLRLREGFELLYDSSALDEQATFEVVAVFVKTLQDTTQVILFALDDGTDILVYAQPDSTWTDDPILLLTEEDMSAVYTGFWFSDWDGDRVFWTCGNHLFTWDFVETITAPATTPDSVILVGDHQSDTTGTIAATTKVAEAANNTVTGGGDAVTAVASADNTTYITLVDENSYIEYSGTALSIPDDADITKVEIIVNVQGASAAAAAFKLQPYISGSYYTGDAAIALASATWVTKKNTYLENPVTGRNWTVAEAEALVRWKILGTDNNPDIRVDYTVMTIEYTTPAPHMRYIINHRGRLFGAKGTDSTVYFSGTDDTGVHSRWENWSAATGQGTQAIIDDGGNMLIFPFGEAVRGLRSTREGLLVFKDKSIVMWDWSDAGAPWEVTQGAKTTILSTGIGLVSHEAITSDGLGLMFLAFDTGNNVGVYRYENGQIERISGSIPNKLKALTPSTNMHCSMFDDMLLIVARKSSDSDASLQCLFDKRTGGWFSLNTPDIVASSTGAAADQLYFASTSKILAFPSSGYTDEDEAIPWSIKTRNFDAGSPFVDKFWRVFWFEGGADGVETIAIDFSVDTEKGNFPIAADDESTSAQGGVDWDDAGITWDSVPPVLWDETGDDAVFYIPLGVRGSAITATVSGAAESRVFIDSIGLAYRDRKPRSIA